LDLTLRKEGMLTAIVSPGWQTFASATAFGAAIALPTTLAAIALEGTFSKSFEGSKSIRAFATTTPRKGGADKGKSRGDRITIPGDKSTGGIDLGCQIGILNVFFVKQTG
jgi:hypothetical protein